MKKNKIKCIACGNTLDASDILKEKGKIRCGICGNELPRKARIVCSSN